MVTVCTKGTVKVLTVGDTHFKENNLDDLALFCQNFYSLANDIKPDLIILLGDIHDHHGRNDVFSATYSNEFIYRCWKITPNIGLIVGNHDRIDNQDFLSKFSFFNSYKNWKGNVVVANKVRRIDIKGHVFLLVPYVYPGRFKEALNTIGDYENIKNDISAIFCHQEFFGAQYGKKSEIGDKWPLDGCKVIAGHIHDYQKINNNICYTGTPITHTYGKERRKTVSLFTFENKEMKEQRFAVESVKKLSMRLTPNELLKWKLPGKNYKIRIEVVCNSKEYLALKKSGIIGRIIKSGEGNVFIRPRSVDKKNNKKLLMDVSSGSFLRQLRGLVKTKEEQKVYCQVFGFDQNIFAKKKGFVIRGL